MIILHFHLQPQYKLNINFMYIYSLSFHCTGAYELNKSTSFLLGGFTAQLVEHIHHTDIEKVTGSNLVEAMIFSGFFLPIA